MLWLNQEKEAALNSIILTYEGFQDQEVVYPYYRLLEEIQDGENVHLFANVTGRIFGILGCHVPANRLISELNDNQVRKNYLKLFSFGVTRRRQSIGKIRQESKSLVSF